MASGTAAPDATSFRLEAHLGSTTWGICSGPFLERAFKTTHVEVNVAIHDAGSWSYDETTTLVIPDRAEPFLHTDTHHLRKVAEPTPNPLARAAR